MFILLLLGFLSMSANDAFGVACASVLAGTALTVLSSSGHMGGAFLAELVLVDFAGGG